MVIVRDFIKVIEFDLSDLPECSNIEVLTIKCQVGFNKSIIISCLYRHPIYQKHTVDLDYTYIEKLLSYLLECNLHFFLMGDFNLRDSYINKLNSILQSLDLVQLVDKATRGRQILDLLICKNATNVNSCKIVDVCLADHKLVYFDVMLKNPKRKKIKVQFRKYDNVNPQLVSQYFPVPSEYIEPNLNVEVFVNNLTQAIDKLAPVCTKSFYPRTSKIYVSDLTKNIIAERDAASCVLRRDPSVENEIKLRQLKKAVKKHIAIDTATEAGRLIKEHGFWKGLRLMQYNKTDNLECLSNSPDEINDFFVNVSKPVCSNDSITELPARPSLLPSIAGNFTFKPISLTELNNAWKSTKNKKSTSLDTMGISPKMLDVCMSSSSFKLNIICLFNSIIISDCIPLKMKCARVVPIAKISKPLTGNDFRPVCIQPNPLKLLEKCMKCQLNAFIDSNNILSVKQYGFRKNHSTILRWCT